VYLSSLLFSGLCGAASVSLPSRPELFWAWAGLRAASGAAAISFNMASNVYRTEVNLDNGVNRRKKTCFKIVGGKWRSIMPAVAASVPAQSGHAALGLLLWLSPDVRWLETAMAGAGLLCLPLWCLMPESPRWLLVSGRVAAGLRVTRKVAKINGRHLKPEDEAALVAMAAVKDDACPEKKRSDLSEIFLYRGGLRRNTLILILVWFSFT